MNNFDIPNIFASIWNKVETTSEMTRVQKYYDLRIFYDNDKEEIENYLKGYLQKKGLYSTNTLNKLIIRHRDNIQKPLKRLTAGIYENPPQRYYVDDEVNSEKLNELLTKINYNAKVKEAFKKTKYFGLTETMPVWDNEKNELRLEVLTPDCFVIQTTGNDYLKKDKIFIQRSKIINNQPIVYYVVYSETEHYLIVGDKTEYVDGNPTGRNGYGLIPTQELRFNETLDYYGEPNWDLFDTQIALDIKRTNNLYTEIFQTFGIYVAINTGLKADEGLSPNKIIKIDNVKTDDVRPELTFVSPDIDWTALRDNIDFEVLDSLRSQGINTSSASLDRTAESGTSKTIDEIEVQEQRESDKETLYNFEIELLKKIITVYNYHAKESLPLENLEVEYSEEKAFESIDDKVKRREMETKYYIKSAVDFIMEDREVSEKEANEIINKNKPAEAGIKELKPNENG